MSFDQYLSGNITAYLLLMKQQLAATHKANATFSRWVHLHYPAKNCTMLAQRQRVLGVAVQAYATVIGRTPSETEVKRVIMWVERNPFTVVDEHLAAQLFVRLHSDVPVSKTMVTTSPRHCCKFSYPLAVPELIAK